MLLILCTMLVELTVASHAMPCTKIFSFSILKNARITLPQVILSHYAKVSLPGITGILDTPLRTWANYWSGKSSPYTRNIGKQACKWLNGRSRNFERGFQLQKNASQTWGEYQKQKKKVVTSFLSHFSLTATSLPTSRTPKPTHWPYFEAIFALRAAHHH